MTPPKPPIELPRPRGSRDPLADEALAWIAHLHSGSESAEDWTRFDAWKAFDADHARAAAKAQKLWDKLGPALLQKTRSRSRVVPIVAALAITLGAVLAWAGVFGEPRALFAEYRTSIGELRRVTLRDGSTVELDSGTSFDSTSDGRTIDLHAGQIFVEVRPDPDRPFEVRSAGGVVRALGTAFVVRRDGLSVNVVVTESAVRVTHGSSEVRIAAGEGATYSRDGRLESPRPLDVAARTAWRRGELTFWGQRLTEVVAEVQRYQRSRLVVLGREIEALPVTGLFDARDIDTLLASLELALPIKVYRLPGLVVITRDADRIASSAP